MSFYTVKFRAWFSFFFSLFFLSPRLAISQSNSVANNPVGGGKAPSRRGSVSCLRRGVWPRCLPAWLSPYGTPKSVRIAPLARCAFCAPPARHAGGSGPSATPAERATVPPREAPPHSPPGPSSACAPRTSSFTSPGSSLEMQRPGPRSRPTEPQNLHFSKIPRSFIHTRKQNENLGYPPIGVFLMN